MLIMGLSKTAFYSSHYVSYLVIMTVSSIVIAIECSGTFLGNSSGFLIWVMFEMLACSIISMCMLIAVFFSKSRIAAIFGPLFMFLTSVPAFALPPDTTVANMKLASLLSPVAFSYGAKLICDYEKSGVGATMSNLYSDDYSLGHSLWFMIIDTLLYLFLAWYLDNVLPSEYSKESVITKRTAPVKKMVDPA
eukprot:gene17961-biopygen28743